MVRLKEWFSFRHWGYRKRARAKRALLITAACLILLRITAAFFLSKTGGDQSLVEPWKTVLMFGHDKIENSFATRFVESTVAFVLGTLAAKKGGSGGESSR